MTKEDKTGGNGNSELAAENRLIELRKGSARMIIDPLGAKIITWKVGGKQVLYSGDADGKIRSTHFCLPNFGPDRADFGLPQHGPARDLLWDVHSRVGDVLVLTLEDLGSEKIVDGLEVDSKYPKGLRAKITCKLSEDGLQIEIELLNRGGGDIPVNPGLHTYFNSPATNGWNGVKYAGVDLAAFIVENTPVELIPTTSEETLFDTKGVLKIPEVGDLEISTKGLPQAMNWTSKTDAGLVNTFFCFEPIAGMPDRFGSDESLLLPGEKKIYRVEMQFLSSHADN